MHPDRFLLPRSLRRISAARGAEGIRTPDPLLARQVLSQLSYNPLGYYSFYRLSLKPYRLPASPTLDKDVGMPAARFKLRFARFHQALWLWA